MVNNQNFLRNDEPMCALDPLLLIPRIEYVDAILSCVTTKQVNYTLAILDMKNFHLINDVYDYNTGDKVLSAFILMLRLRLPKESISLRFRHGDEFLFFLPLEKPETITLFSDFNLFAIEYPFLKKPDGNNFPISFRFAILELAGLEGDSHEVLRIAESKLREVKGQGSLRTV